MLNHPFGYPDCEYALFSPFVGIAKMWQGSTNQNNTLYWIIISFICALISQHNVRLGHKPSFIKKLNSENYFPNFHHDAWNLDRY